MISNSNSLSIIAKETSEMVYNTVGGLGVTAWDDGGDRANHEREEARNEGAREEPRDVERPLGSEYTEMKRADLLCHSRKLSIDLSMSRSMDRVGDGEDGEEGD